LTFQKQM